MASSEVIEVEEEETLVVETNVSSSPSSPPPVQAKVQRAAVSEDEYPAQPTVSFFE